MLNVIRTCDLCGLPCDHEWRYTIKMKRYFSGALGAELGPEKLDICKDCQEKVVEYILKRKREEQDG